MIMVPIIALFIRDDCMGLNVVIMAAGKGTRMKSALPKVLHRLAGTSLLQHVLNAAAGVGADRTVVITGHGADEVEAALAGSTAVFARQMPQRGTGHAVQMAVPQLDPRNEVTLILYGDVPLIRPGLSLIHISHRVNRRHEMQRRTMSLLLATALAAPLTLGLGGCAAMRSVSSEVSTCLLYTSRCV